MISKVPSNFNPNIIADFAVGKGILFWKKAKNKWSASKFVANDLCLESIQAVQECNLNWNCTNFNFFLDYDSIINSELQLYLNIIDLILNLILLLAKKIKNIKNGKDVPLRLNQALPYNLFIIL